MTEYNQAAYDERPIEAAPQPLHERLSLAEKRIGELEEYLRKTEQYMARVSRELGI